ncbi:HtrA protease/chaperone protein [hydrothermal vent metagenome]|uniref:HtrA protease/chaperone protein n=1 Tax=hydrothermal vent metagenome TaxID=652676 RepID=A0A3B1DV37_9ZZZZ
MRSSHSLLPLCRGLFLVLFFSTPAFTKEAPAKPDTKSHKKHPLSKVFEKKVPRSIEDLKAIEKQVQAIEKKITAVTVGIRIGRASGSGVIVTEDGYILTAAHVCGAPGRKLTIIFPDGKKVKGVSLGSHRRYDAGLIKITEEGKWQYAEMADYKSVKTGDWAVALGHPGGFKKGRAPVLRLGRVIRKQSKLLQTDCVIVGGDSGGPLFDMHGRVIGINSRIGPALSWNFHAPISAYTKYWDAMAASEVIGGKGAILGVNGEKHPQGTRVTDVPEGYPAAKAGIQVGDVITKFAGKKPTGIENLARLVTRRNVGEKVNVEILRDGKTIQLKVKLEARK